MNAPVSLPKLVIFDCDGVLVDSEAIAGRMLFEVLRDHGSDLTLKGCFRRFHGTNRHAVEGFMADQGTPLPDGWAGDYYQRSFDAFRRELTPVEGAPDVLATLRAAGMAHCVASNGMVEKMQVTLGLCGMLEHLEGRLYSAYDAGMGKPAPDVFLHAAKVHGVAASDCIVIEDSAAGLEAAARAGMVALAYLPPGAPRPGDLFGARAFTAMQDLPELLGIKPQRATL